MECPEFLEEFSEYYDGLAPEPVVQEMERHLASCPRCRRYARTVAEGAALLRAIPPLEPSPDFRARLESRLALALTESRPVGVGKVSGVSALALAALTVLLALAAWAPLLDRPGSVELPAVVAVSPPAARTLYRGTASAAAGRLPLLQPEAFTEGMWGDSHSLLYQYSRLSGRYRSSALVRVGVQ